MQVVYIILVLEANKVQWDQGTYTIRVVEDIKVYRAKVYTPFERWGSPRLYKTNVCTPCKFWMRSKTFGTNVYTPSECLKTSRSYSTKVCTPCTFWRRQGPASPKGVHHASAGGHQGLSPWPGLASTIVGTLVKLSLDIISTKQNFQENNLNLLEQLGHKLMHRSYFKLINTSI